MFKLPTLRWSKSPVCLFLGALVAHSSSWFSRWWRRPTPQRRWVLSVRWTGAIRWWSTAKSPWKPLRSAARTAGSCLTLETWPTTSSPSIFSETSCSECRISTMSRSCLAAAPSTLLRSFQEVRAAAAAPCGPEEDPTRGHVGPTHQPRQAKRD